MSTLELTNHEIPALLLLVLMGANYYYDEEDGGEARDQLDRIPNEHLASLILKIRKAAGEAIIDV